MTDAHLRFTENPFYILGVAPDKGRVEIEREGAKLLGMLALGLRSVSTYQTPAGPRPRTEEAVRAALAELRIPDRRLLHELWASAPTTSPAAATEADEPAAATAKATQGDPYRERPKPTPATGEASAGPPGFDGAFALFGWRRP